MATILHMTYKAGQSWNAKIAEWFPEARPGNIPQDIHIILDCGSGIIRSIATEVKDEDSDLHNTLKGHGKGGKVAIELQESYICRELRFDEVWLLYVRTNDVSINDIETLESICFRKAFLKGYETKNAALLGLRDMITNYSPDAKPIAYINMSDLPTIYHRMLAQITGTGQIAQDCATDMLKEVDSLGVQEFFEIIDKALRSRYPNDNRTRIFNEFYTTGKISKLGGKKTTRRKPRSE